MPMSVQKTARTVPLADARMRRVALLIELEKKARAAKDMAELGFVVVNETYNLTPYREAMIWSHGAGHVHRGHVVAMSGVAVPDRHAPFVLWAEELFSWVSRQAEFPRLLTIDDMPDHLAEGWREAMPEQAIILPLSERDGAAPDLALFARDEPWGQGDQVILGNLFDAYGHEWSLMEQRAPWYQRIPLRKGAVKLLLAALVIAIGAIPLRHSVLAPVEVVAREPDLVRSAVDGVIDEVLVRPGDAVSSGQTVVNLDRQRLANNLQIAVKARDIAQAELRQTSQMAIFDPQSKAAITLLEGRVAQHSEEVAYYEDLLGRSSIQASRAGVAVFDSVVDLTGKPVTVGERVMMIADPAEVEAEIHLPVGDLIRLEEGAEVLVFLNVDAARPLDATLSQMGFQSTPLPAGGFAYRMTAQFGDAEQPPRIGLKGTAKIYGDRTFLAMYVFRRPVAVMRRWLGL